MNSPRNIVAIDRIQAGEIIGLRRLSASCVAVSSDTPWESIPIKVPAKLIVSEKIEDGVRMYTAQLVFRTCEDPGNRSRMVYRCWAADGRYYLIGTNDRPFPVTTVTTNHPDNMSDNQLDEVAVSYTSASRIPYIQ